MLNKINYLKNCINYIQLIISTANEYIVYVTIKILIDAVVMFLT